MDIHIEYVRMLKEELAKINRGDLKDMRFFENGELLKVDPKDIKEFTFMGLNNVDFIMSDMYKRGDGHTRRFNDKIAKLKAVVEAAKEVKRVIKGDEMQKVAIRGMRPSFIPCDRMEELTVLFKVLDDLEDN